MVCQWNFHPANSQSSPLWFYSIDHNMACLYLFPRAAVTNYHKLGGLTVNRNLFIHNSGNQKSKVKVVSLPLEALEKILFLASSSFWWLLADLIIHNSSLSFHGNITSGSSIYLFFLCFLEDNCHWM